MQYAYTAKTIGGETASGLLSADSPAVVQQQLREKGLFVVSLKPAQAAAAGSKGLSRSFGRNRVSKRDLMALTSQLAIMSRAGLDLAGALQSLARQCKHPALKATLEQVHQDVLAGKAVSVALRMHSEVFGNTYIASVAAGEASGRLPEVLSRLATLQRSEIRLRGTLRTLLAYPIVLASASLLVVISLMFFVLPQFSDVFAQFDMPLPAITQVLLDISDELRTRYWLWGTLFIGGVAGLIVYRSSDSGQRWWDRLVLNGMLIRDVTRSLLIGRAFRLLGIMIESGVPLLDGLRLTSSSIRNTQYQELFENLERDVLNGRGLAGALGNAAFVPPAAAEMVLTAERTGTLGMVTQVMGEFYEEEGETRLRELATLLEPLIIIVMGAFVAIVVLAVMLPMFDFATFQQGGK